MLPQALGLDHHARVRSLRERLDRHDRRTEILHVEAALEVARQRRPDELDDQLAPLLADVDAGRRIGHVDDDPAFAVAAAPEVHVAQHVLDVAGPGLGEALDHLRRRVERLALVEQRH